jgi:pilus assembly protein Flp/PilA
MTRSQVEAGAGKTERRAEQYEANRERTKGTFPMRKLKNAVVNFLKREDGPTAVEYAVMLALIIVVCIAAISALGSNASNTFNYVGNKVSTTSS